MYRRRQRMKTGYGIPTWCKRADELGAELWLYQEKGELTLKQAQKVAGLLAEATEVMNHIYKKNRGVL